MNQTDTATVFGEVRTETLNKIREVIRLTRKRRILLSQKELVGRLVTESIDRALEEAQQQSPVPSS
jgi:hypothetical protein